ncbi:MAG: glycosyltransferase family 2 protein [Pseudomonadota bacterium]
MTASLSVIVITCDEADRIDRCLASVQGWVDELIVFDSGSQDDTVEIVRRYTDKVWETDWPGYGKQKQRALEQATGQWVLSIDADEVVSPELRDEILALLKGKPHCNMYRLPWGVMLFGRQLRYGRSGRAPRRLFLREGARFSDAAVHESVLLSNEKSATLNGHLLHYSHRNLKHAFDKFSKYAWLWAQARHARGQKAGIGTALGHGLWMFLHIYFFRLGMLDGWRGLLMAVLYGQYTFNKYAALWSLGFEQNGVGD